ncbi:MAG TPA: primosomal protein N' [Cyclobacteriaceae bacterium]|nr:primosomal protein N' [Cyclobacteriaceae bacterium]
MPSSENRITLFADLVLPVPVPRLFTYRVPADWNNLVMRGMRVIVPFGARKILTGIIAQIHEKPPTAYEAKYILEVLDDHEIITERQFQLYDWMASYYLCTPGEVLNAALPSGLKLSSESMVQLHPGFVLDESEFDFSDKERMLINHLQTEAMSYTDIAKLLGAKSIYSILKSLSGKEAIVLFEKVKEKFRPKTETYYRMTATYTGKKKLEALFERLGSKPKQEALVLKYLQEVPVFNNPALNEKGLSRRQLLGDDGSESSLRTLIKSGILEEFVVIVPRFGFEDEQSPVPTQLSAMQIQVRDKILGDFETSGAALLHGITGSGKTEIYIDLIRRALDGGNQVLYLLPEIALTTQIVQRLKRIFGSLLGVYHSKFSDNERVEVWQGIQSGKFRFIIGVRSSVFLPFDSLGLIIVDEEHDPSYKQQEPAPRYHARDVARMMAQHHQAKVLLGTATPSCETWYQAINGKIGFASLTERFGEAQLPQVVYADVSRERKQKTMKGEFTNLLLREIKGSLDTHEQVILFQNRRGHSPMVECQDCGWIPTCINCAVSLTYHQYRHALICHYCGYKEELPAQCPTCSSKRILTLGYGTERIEEELKLLFPDASIGRMDLETTRTRSAYEGILSDFESGTTNILVGTQMVTKGLDFDRVNLVSVFDADRMMYFPDFRSHERAFQLIIQVSGRAGRRTKPGKVVIQTAHPRHPLFDFVSRHDISGFLEDQLHDRELHGYPPFTRLIEITFKHIDKNTGRQAADRFAQSCRNQLKDIAVMGPAEPMISKIRNEYLATILLKIPRQSKQLQAIKDYLRSLMDYIQGDKAMRNTKIVFDVDPV